MSKNSKKQEKKEREEIQNNADFQYLDQKLRPLKWNDYIGQKNAKENLHILLSAAKERKHPAEHILFYGPPGLGKTTLAYLIAKELNSQIKVTSGPAIERVGDLASILTNLSPGDVLFIDEVHRLNKAIEEVLYPAMESGVLDIVLGKGPSARTVQLELPPFTLIAATTRIALLSSPLRSRFSGGVFRLEYYTEEEISEIIRRSAKILEIDVSEDAVKEIAKRSRFTPRTANYILKRCRDFAQIKKKNLDKKTVTEALELLGIDEKGLTAIDRKIIEIIGLNFRGGPVGLNTLAASISEEMATIEEYNEPYLIQIGFLERTPRGRVVTGEGFKHISKDFGNEEVKTRQMDL